MTDDLVRIKTKEALASTNGDKHDAQKLLITWAVRDPQLLLGITKPHLKAITSALVEHMARARGEAADNGPDQFTRTAIDDIVASATSGKRGPEKRRNSNIPPPKSTERQANAMRKLAAAFTRKKKTD